MSQEILQQCTVEGTIVKLPEGQLERNVYMDVKKRLELIGGKWKGGKVQGFVFDHDPSALLEQIANGENRNLQKEYQFFATPAELAAQMVAMSWVRYGDRILEPSAGQGAIINAIQEATGHTNVDCYELMDLNRSVLNKIKNVNVLGEDFLQCDRSNYYDVVIANPPFTKNQDIDHIRKMHEVTKPGGIIVTIASPSWSFGSQKKQVDFKSWLENIDADITDLPENTFKDSGTSIRSKLIKIRK